MRVSAVTAMAHGETKPFEFERAGTVEEGFILRYAKGFYAYANDCPHWNVDLDLGMQEFFDERYDALVCKNHGALFDPTTGLCRAGPCAGGSLQRFEVALEGDDAVVRVPLLRVLLG